MIHFTTLQPSKSNNARRMWNQSSETSSQASAWFGWAWVHEPSLLWFILREVWMVASTKRRSWRKWSCTTFCSERKRRVCRFTSEKCLLKTAIWSLSKILHSPIPQMQTSNSWKSTFLLIPQRSGDMKIPIRCFSDQNGMTFGALNDSGPSFLSEFIGIPDRLISVGSCGVCGRKCETQTLRLWPDLCTSSRQRWTRSTVWRGRKFREISILGRAHMLANALCANLENLSVV